MGVQQTPRLRVRTRRSRPRRSSAGPGGSRSRRPYHFGSCGRNLFFGFRLHTTVTDAGAIVEFALASANEGERAVAEGMLAAVPPAETGVVLGDNNYCGDRCEWWPRPTATSSRRPRKTDKDRTSRLGCAARE